jgi:hypothetical protein
MLGSSAFTNNFTQSTRRKIVRLDFLPRRPLGPRWREIITLTDVQFAFADDHMIVRRAISIL